MIQPQADALIRTYLFESFGNYFLSFLRSEPFVRRVSVVFTHWGSIENRRFGESAHSARVRFPKQARGNFNDERASERDRVWV